MFVLEAKFVLKLLESLFLIKTHSIVWKAELSLLCDSGASNL